MSKIQQQFKRSQAAYLQAENLQQHSTISLDQLPEAFQQHSTVSVGKDQDLEKGQGIDPGKSAENSNASFMPVLLQTETLHKITPCLPILELAHSSKPAASKPFTPAYIPSPDSLSSGSTFPCRVAHIETHNTLFIKKLPINDILPLDTDFPSDVPHLKEFSPGTPCLAEFSEDRRWYRAEIVSCDQANINILFVDYGLTQTISDLGKLLILPEHFAVFPRQAIACILPSLPSPMETGLPENQFLTLLANLIGNNKYLCTVLANSDDKRELPEVELRMETDKTCLSELLADALVALDYESL